MSNRRYFTEDFKIDIKATPKKVDIKADGDEAKEVEDLARSMFGDDFDFFSAFDGKDEATEEVDEPIDNGFEDEEEVKEEEVEEGEELTESYDDLYVICRQIRHKDPRMYLTDQGYTTKGLDRYTMDIYTTDAKKAHIFNSKEEAKDWITNNLFDYKDINNSDGSIWIQSINDSVFKQDLEHSSGISSEELTESVNHDDVTNELYQVEVDKHNPKKLKLGAGERRYREREISVGDKGAIRVTVLDPKELKFADRVAKEFNIPARFAKLGKYYFVDLYINGAPELFDPATDSLDFSKYFTEDLTEGARSEVDAIVAGWDAGTDLKECGPIEEKCENCEEELELREDAGTGKLTDTVKKLQAEGKKVVVLDAMDPDISMKIKNLKKDGTIYLLDNAERLKDPAKDLNK